MSRAKVFITRRLPNIDLEQLHQIAKVETWSGKQPPPYSILLDKVKQIDGLLCLLTDAIDRKLIETGTSLKVISQMAVGYDNINVAAATARGIPVGNTPGVLTERILDFRLKNFRLDATSHAPKFIYGVNLKSPICNLQLLD